jgi:uncharacterized protein (TIGR03435 family)
MKRREKSEILSRALGLFSEPSAERMEEARLKVLLGLQSKNDEHQLEILETPPVSGARRPSLKWVLAAALVVVVLLPAAMFWIGRTPGVLQDANGSHKMAYGGMVRSSGEGAVVTLKDGSRIEMRSKSELALEQTDDGVRIRLDRGSVIVTAAKQHNGHLYVRTKDVTVSVVGTVFLVNSEEDGSRVAVIQGEVHIQQGPTSRKLLPGQQIATGPSMTAVGVPEEISWSREREAHLALLQKTVTPVSDRKLAFDAESIRPHSGQSPNGQQSIGFICHGIDGVRRSGSEYISSVEGRLTAPLGRCVGKGVLLANLIGFAYGVPPREIQNLPDWAVPPDHLVNVPAPPANAFQIEAVAPDPPNTTVEELIQMVREMLERRFQLQVRRESKEVPGFALVVAKDGPKPALKENSDAEVLPCLEVNSEGKPTLRGNSKMDKLARWLGGYLGCLGSVGGPVVDKTELKGIYEYEFVTVAGGGGGGGPRGGPPAGQAPRMVSELLADAQRQAAANMSALLEENLGLRLQSEKAVPVNVVVIDHVEKPSPN